MDRFTLKKAAFAFNVFYTKILNKTVNYLYNKNYRLYLREQKIPNKPAPLEKEWIQKWSVLQRPKKASYRVYSARYKPDVNIVPDEVSHNIILPILNPVRFRFCYEDKNIYDKLFPTEYTAATLLRKMNGFYYDADYRRIEQLTDSLLLQKVQQFDTIVIKPTIDSHSGSGVMLFEKNPDGSYTRMQGTELLTVDFLKKQYGEDFIIQERLPQSEFMNRFNPTSVNTLRMAVYRSVKDDSYVVTGAAVRMGGNGSLVDNATVGGAFVGINSDGTLGKWASSSHADFYTTHNGIDFSKEEIRIPDYDRIKAFAIDVARRVPHHRLFAMDIMIDRDGNPRLIEFNLSSFSVKFYQLTLTSVFGEYTDEVIEYCTKHKKEAMKVMIKFA